MRPLAITLGDPAGVGAEVVFKAIEAIGPVVPVVVFGDRNLASQTATISSWVDFVDIGDGQELLRVGTVDPHYGRIALASIDAAVTAVEEGRCSALVTAPIHKQSIDIAGSPFPGHTELLASRAGLHRYAYDYAMYFDSPRLCTVLLTVHLSLRDAIAAIDAEGITALAQLTSREFQRLHGRLPRIAVAGVNPHAGEGGKFGMEETIVAAGVAAARSLGLEVTGPHPPDTIFLAASRGKHDVVMAMYHDQGLIPVKTLDFEHSVNVTIGLPWLRASVDHGTAFDIAGRGVADAVPMRWAIEWTAKHAESYRG